MGVSLPSGGVLMGRKGGTPPPRWGLKAGELGLLFGGCWAHALGCGLECEGEVSGSGVLLASVRSVWEFRVRPGHCEHRIFRVPRRLYAQQS